MPVKVDNTRAGKLCPQPWEAKIDAVELQNCTSCCTIDKNVDIPFQLGIPIPLIHEEPPPNPVFFIISAQLRQAVILMPIIIDVSVVFISVPAASRCVEPPSFVERLIIGSAAGNVSKHVP